VVPLRLAPDRQQVVRPTLREPQAGPWPGHRSPSLNPARLTKPALEPPKHVIAEYRHRELHVTCICGWEGSVGTDPRQPDEWKAHLAANRDGKR